MLCLFSVNELQLCECGCSLSPSLTSQEKYVEVAGAAEPGNGLDEWTHAGASAAVSSLLHSLGSGACLTTSVWLSLLPSCTEVSRRKDNPDMTLSVFFLVGIGTLSRSSRG